MKQWRWPAGKAGSADADCPAGHERRRVFELIRKDPELADLKICIVTVGPTSRF